MWTFIEDVDVDCDADDSPEKSDLHSKNSGSFQLFLGLYTSCVQISAQS